MYWQIELRQIGKLEGLTITVDRDLRGYAVRFTVRYTCFAWDWDNRGPLDIIPTTADITFETSTGPVLLTAVPAESRAALRPAPHESETTFAFVAVLTAHQLAAFERSRAGNTFRVGVAVHARGYVNGALTEGRMVEDRTFDADRDKWLAQLRTAGFLDTLIIELPVPDSRHTPELSEAMAHLRRAIDHQSHGRAADAVGSCRVAAQALEQAGFGKHAPSDVIMFIKENARRLTMGERFSALRAALELFCHPPHHPGAHDDIHASDGIFAIAVTAAILGLAPVRGVPVTAVSPETPGS